MGDHQHSTSERFLQNVLFGSGAHSAFCSVGTEDASVGIVRPGFEARASCLSAPRANAENDWSYFSTPMYRDPDGPLGLQEVEAPRNSRQSAPAVFTPGRISGTHFC